MKVKATKRKSEAADSLHGEGHSSKISKVRRCFYLPWHRAVVLQQYVRRVQGTVTFSVGCHGLVSTVAWQWICRQAGTCLLLPGAVSSSSCACRIQCFNHCLVSHSPLALLCVCCDAVCLCRLTQRRQVLPAHTMPQQQQPARQPSRCLPCR
jgi:hypothetical protein